MCGGWCSQVAFTGIGGASSVGRSEPDGDTGLAVTPTNPDTGRTFGSFGARTAQ